MPNPFVFCTLLCFVFTSTKCQNTNQDSINLIKLIQEQYKDSLDTAKKPSSYFTLNVGVGNKLFSVKNNAVNSSQSQVNQLFYTTSISYHYKTGFGLSVMPFFSSTNGSLKVYQTAITPAYNSYGKSFDIGVSYTRYVADYKAYNSNATYQNDFFTTLKYTKKFLQPSVNLGYTTGNFKEINIDTIKALNNRIVKDSTNNNIKNFSMSFGLEHSFYFEKVLHTKAEISFTPQLLLIAGAQKFATIHTNKGLVFLQNKSKKFKSRTQTQTDALKLQSVAMSLDATYSIGKFSLSPNIFLDYYLNATTDKRLTNMYSVSAGISF